MLGNYQNAHTLPYRGISLGEIEISGMSSLVTWADVPCPAATRFCSFSVCVGEAMIESGYLPLAAIETPVDHKTDIDLSRFCQPIAHHP